MLGGPDASVVSNHSHPQASMGAIVWKSCVLHLPRPLEARFVADSSVQRHYTLSDLLASVLMVIVFWRFMRVFEVISTQTATLGQRLSIATFFMQALLQVVWIAAAPQHYRRHRHAVTMANRLLRLALMALVALQVTPRSMEQQKKAFYHVVKPLPAAWCPDMCQELAKLLLLSPAVHLLPSYYVVAFRHALPLQLATFVLSLAIEEPRTCASLQRQDGTFVASSALCRHMGEFAHAATQLLAWDVPASPAQLAAASDSLCSDPLAALVMLKVAVHFLVLVVLPLVIVWGMERSLKVKFLANQGILRLDDAGTPLSQAQLTQHVLPAGATLAGPTAAAGGNARASSSRQSGAAVGQGSALTAVTPQQEQQEQQPHATFAAAALSDPFAVAPLVHLGWPGTTLVLSGLLVFCAVVVWHATELGMLWFMRVSQRRLVCDAEGWLVLQSVQQHCQAA